ncbi:MAG: alpha/beta hydrolase [Dehalococcoidia bacterium]
MDGRRGAGWGRLLRGFTLDRGGRTLPGVFWFPANPAGPAPIVLMGHGGSGDKRNERMTMLGQMFAAEYGWCAAAIDGPVHGDRGTITDAGDPQYRAMWKRPDVVEEMIGDWRATLSALSELDAVDGSRAGYWGLSMGTMFGLPFVASENRLSAAVLGKAGMIGSSVERSGIDVHFERYAPRVALPVLFTIQWDDAQFLRSGQLDLFDRIGSADKRLHAYPGGHGDNGPEAFVTQAEFLKRYL